MAAPAEGNLGDLVGGGGGGGGGGTPDDKKKAAAKAAADKVAADKKAADDKAAADAKAVADKVAADKKAVADKTAADAKAAADKAEADKKAADGAPVDEDLAPADPPKEGYSGGKIAVGAFLLLLVAFLAYLAINRNKTAEVPPGGTQAGLVDPTTGGAPPVPAPVDPAVPPVVPTPAPAPAPVPSPAPAPDLSGTDADLALRVDDLQNQLNVAPEKLEAMRTAVAAARAGANSLVIHPDSCASVPNQPHCNGAVMKEDYDYLNSPKRHPRDLEFEMKAFDQARTP